MISRKTGREFLCFALVIFAPIDIDCFVVCKLVDDQDPIEIYVLGNVSPASEFLAFIAGPLFSLL